VTPTLFLFQLLNGATFGALLFLVASGFTLIFGLMRVTNLAHGALYLVGGYVAWSAVGASGSFAIGAVAAFLAVAVLGALIDRGLLVFVRDRALPQVLLTLGIAFVVGDLSLVVWGGDPLTIPIPPALGGIVQLGPLAYPKYRLFVLAMGALVAVGLWALLHRTKLGALIRAGVDDAEMVEAIGINIERVFALAFMLGAGLAGLAGTLGGAFLTLYTGADGEILVFSLAVVIIGGLGSLLGTLVGSLLVGILATFGQVLFPELAYFVIFGPMALLLAFRPWGLFGRPA
jgi:branched-chain amino acid transport system permease protein